MKVLTGDKTDGWVLNVTDLEFRIIASVFKELIVQSVTSPLMKESTEQSRSSMASFACEIYNEMVNARGGIEDVTENETA